MASTLYASNQAERIRRFYSECHHLILLLEYVGVMVGGVDGFLDDIRLSVGDFTRFLCQLTKKRNILKFGSLFRRMRRLRSPDVRSMRRALRQRTKVLLAFADWNRDRVIQWSENYMRWSISNGIDRVDARMCVPFGSPPRCEGCSSCKLSVWLLRGEKMLNPHYRYKSMDEQARHREFLERQDFERLEAQLEEAQMERQSLQLD